MQVEFKKLDNGGARLKFDIHEVTFHVAAWQDLEALEPAERIASLCTVISERYGVMYVAPVTSYLNELWQVQ